VQGRAGLGRLGRRSPLGTTKLLWCACAPFQATADAAEAFASSAELKAAMEKAGVTSAP